MPPTRTNPRRRMRRCSACSPSLPGLRVAMLHAEDAVETLRADVPEQVLVVHLARARFLAARVVADLEVRDLAPGVVDVRHDVALVALHVVHVVEDLAGRTIYRAADGVRLVGGAQEQVRVVGQRLEHHREAGRLEDLRARRAGCRSRCPSGCRSAVCARNSPAPPSPTSRSRACPRPPPCGRSARNLSRNSALPVVSEVFQLSPPSMTNTPMVMPRLRQRLADLLLHVDGPAHEAVVLERREALVGHEVELGDEIRRPRAP